eukprot:scaffold37491_cov30-Tisochrysis_lutea.AAC.5
MIAVAASLRESRHRARYKECRPATAATFIARARRATSQRKRRATMRRWIRNVLRTAAMARIRRRRAR